MRDKLSLHEITKRTGLSRNTIRRWLRTPEEARMLLDLCDRRNLITACEKQIQKIRDREKTPSEHLVDLNAALEGSISRTSMSKFMTDREVSKIILTKLSTPQNPYSTGLSVLDLAMEGGFFPGMNYLFAGRKKMGKTTMAGTLSCNLNRQKIKHLYVACEMGIEQIQQRNLSRLTNTFSSSFRTEYGKTEAFKQKITEQITASNNCTIYLNAPGITFEDLRRSVAQAISIYGIKGFIVDSLQLVGGKPERKSQSEHQDEVAQWIADFGRKHNVFSLVTAQINQTGNIRGGESVRLACDMGFEIHAPEDDPSRSARWLEMIETRYTGWNNVGSDNSPVLTMNEKGPYLHEPDYQTPIML